MEDLPIQELARMADEAIRMTGGRVYFTYTCGGCGGRVRFDEPNTLYERGHCDRCGWTTVLQQGGFDLEYDEDRAWCPFGVGHP